MPNAFGGRAGFYITHVISFLRESCQLLLWWGVEDWRWRDRAGAWGEAGFSSAQWPLLPYQGWGLIPSWLCFLKFMFSPLPGPGPWTQSEGVQKLRGSRRLSACVGHGWRAKLLQCASCRGAHSCLPRYAQGQPWEPQVQVPTVPHSRGTVPSLCCPRPVVERHHDSHADLLWKSVPSAWIVVEGWLPGLPTASKALPKQAAMMATATTARLCPRSGSPLYPMAKSSLWSWPPHIQSCAVTQSETGECLLGWAGAHVQAVTCGMPGSH